MFPEGTRHGGPELLNFKKGAFHVAISAQCPVQPVVVSKYLFLDHEKRIFDHGKSLIIVFVLEIYLLMMFMMIHFSGHIVITILPPISTKGLTKDDLTGLIDKSRIVMQDIYTKSSEEMKTKYYNVS